MSETIEELKAELAAEKAARLKAEAAARRISEILEHTAQARDEARAACAEMRALIEDKLKPEYDNRYEDTVCHVCSTLAEDGQHTKDCRYVRALSSDCGASLLAAHRLAIEALEYVQQWWDETGRDAGWHASIGVKVDKSLAALKGQP